MISTPVTSTATEQLTRLVYELADAHDDTARLARDPASMLDWEIHLDYLRALQRLTRETLARL